jgi:hypothetical protein
MYQLALPGVVACVTDRYWIVRRGNIGTTDHSAKEHISLPPFTTETPMTAID